MQQSEYLASVGVRASGDGGHRALRASRLATQQRSQEAGRSAGAAAGACGKVRQSESLSGVGARVGSRLQGECCLR